MNASWVLKIRNRFNLIRLMSTVLIAACTAALIACHTPRFVPSPVRNRSIMFVIRGPRDANGHEVELSHRECNATLSEITSPPMLNWVLSQPSVAGWKSFRTSPDKQSELLKRTRLNLVTGERDAVRIATLTVEASSDDEAQTIANAYAACIKSSARATISNLAPAPHMWNAGDYYRDGVLDENWKVAAVLITGTALSLASLFLRIERSITA